MRSNPFYSFLLSFFFISAWSISASSAEEWQVRKSSGEVWMTSKIAQQVSLKQGNALEPGDSIRTGNTGRVLLVRGEESILISPNSIVSLPKKQKKSLSTTILQQAGSILLNVEKRNVKHFEVETPYLAAVVKGTQFKVTVEKNEAKVDVVQGKVEVADFKTGQFALVLPGQSAKVLSKGGKGLQLKGIGKLSPVLQGKPRKTNLKSIKVPASGLKAPRIKNNGKTIQAKSLKSKGIKKARVATLKQKTNKRRLGVRAKDSAKKRTIRTSRLNNKVRKFYIRAPIGQVRMNFQKATRGLSRARTNNNITTRRGKKRIKKATIWNGGSLKNQGISSPGYSSSNKTTGNAISAAVSNAGGNGNSNAGGNGNGNAGGNGNSNAGGNGNGNGNGNAGGNGNGNGNGNAGGNGKGKGKGKK